MGFYEGTASTSKGIGEGDNRDRGEESRGGSADDAPAGNFRPVDLLALRVESTVLLHKGYCKRGGQEVEA